MIFINFVMGNCSVKQRPLPANTYGVKAGGLTKGLLQVTDTDIIFTLHTQMHTQIITCDEIETKVCLRMRFTCKLCSLQEL